MTSGTLRKLKDVGRRPDIEADLNDKYHVSWDYVSDVPTSDFDIDKSLKNQARFEAINEDTVEQYKEGVDRGDAFPAVIAFRRRRGGKLEIIDGNHRLVAHERAGKPIDVYEVATGTRPQTTTLMTFAFNTRHGRPTSEEERTQQALYLMENGATMGVAAGAVNVPERILRRAVAKQQSDKRAIEVGADQREWDALGQSARNRLLNVSTDEGFKDAIHLSFVAGLSADEVFDVVALMNETKSAAKQRAIVKAKVEEFGDRIQDNAGGVLNRKTNRGGLTARGRLGIALGHLTALPEDVGSITRAYVGDDRTTNAKSFMEASRRLSNIAHALDPKVK